MSVHHLPLEPLLDLLHLTPGPSNGRHGPGWAEQIADLAEVKPRQVHRWVAQGGIPDHAADCIAIAVGLHPALIWPDWYAEVA